MKEELYDVFVYGTLLSGERNHHVAQPYLRRKEAGHVKGFLYKVDYYPALVLDINGSEIEGEWFTVTKEGLHKMDQLEGYEAGSENNHYDRVWTKDSAKNREGFIYVYTAEQASSLDLIKGCSWKEYNHHKSLRLQ